MEGFTATNEYQLICCLNFTFTVNSMKVIYFVYMPFKKKQMCQFTISKFYKTGSVNEILSVGAFRYFICHRKTDATLSHVKKLRD